MFRIPNHPGELLREETLPALEMEYQEFANHIGLPESLVERLMACAAPVTPDIAFDIALCLEKALGPDAQTWFNMQANHDLARLRQEAREELDRITPLRERAA